MIHLLYKFVNLYIANFDMNIKNTKRRCQCGNILSQCHKQYFQCLSKRRCEHNINSIIDSLFCENGKYQRALIDAYKSMDMIKNISETTDCNNDIDSIRIAKIKLKEALTILEDTQVFQKDVILSNESCSTGINRIEKAQHVYEDIFKLFRT